jgi:hypothetical protein
MARSKKNSVESGNVVAVVHDWSWLVGEKGLIEAPKTDFYDREMTDAQAKKIMSEAKRVAKIAEEGDFSEFIEKRLRAEAKHLVATAYYQQREVDGVKNISKNIEVAKAKKAKYEKILAKLQEGAKKTEDKEEEKEE